MGNGRAAVAECVTKRFRSNTSSCSILSLKLCPFFLLLIFLFKNIYIYIPSSQRSRKKSEQPLKKRKKKYERARKKREPLGRVGFTLPPRHSREEDTPYVCCFLTLRERESQTQSEQIKSTVFFSFNSNSFLFCFCPPVCRKTWEA